ncbi:MAG TPA: ATP-binding protein [Actinoplanes sp.]
MAVGSGAGANLLGRRSECAELEQLMADVRAGTSRVLVLRGDAGVGKSALLRHLSDRLAGWRVMRAAGVEAEMELAYSALHQLCAPLLDRLDQLPGPQRDALATVFGLHSGPPPDRFLVGLATLTLIAGAADDHPLACLVDDAQWLDQASAQIVGFVARRLLAERVALVCAARTGAGNDVLTGLPAMVIGGLGPDDARALLLDNLSVPLDAAVCDQIVMECHGNPLALLELPRTWSTTGLAGGFGLPGRPVAGKIEDSYLHRLRMLPPDTRLLVLAAAAEPCGDPVLLQRAARILNLDVAAAAPAADAGLLRVRRWVEFAHPLVRSAVYRRAGPDDRHRVHRALAEATDAAADPDRRAWHRARGTSGPDEEVAAELERSAGRAQARGGLAAAAAFLTRATELTGDPTARAHRALAAAAANAQAGAFEPPVPCSPSRAKGRSTTCSGPGSTCWAPSWPRRRAGEVKPRPCCWRRPGAWSRWISNSRGRPIWMRSPRVCSRHGWRTAPACTTWRGLPVPRHVRPGRSR